MTLKYSILIPTFNRRDLLEKTIETVLEQNYNDFELVISDSGSKDKTWDFLSSIKKPNVKIFKHEKRLSEVENFEFIISKASGSWVSIIGDDDGLAPNFFRKLDDVIEKYPDISAISTNAGFYYHPDIEDLYGDRVISYNQVSDKVCKKNSKLNLLLCLMGLKNRSDVPSLYTTGIVKKNLINQIKKKSGNKFFHSIIEDYYSMVSILYETNNFIRIEKPLFWIGSSKTSSGKGISVYENNKHVEDYLKVSDKISMGLHMVGISSIYFLEAVFKHPYISNFWKSNYFHKIALVYSYIDIKSRTDLDRIKINLSMREILSLIFLELKKMKVKKINFFFYVAILKVFFYFKLSSYYLVKLSTYIKKLFFKKKIITINSNDREVYKNIPTCNKIIVNLSKKIS